MRCMQQEMAAEKMKLERQADDQGMQIKSMETDLQTAATVKADLESRLKQSDDQCTLWRTKARHRHRALEIREMPKFDKTREGKAEQAKWLKDRALHDALGFDSDNDKPVTVTFNEPPPIGLGLLNCKDTSGDTSTVIHTIKEVNLCIPLVCRRLYMYIANLTCNVGTTCLRAHLQT